MNLLDHLGPLYHSYRLFGIDNKQVSQAHEMNQKSKEGIILAYIQYALAKSKNKSSEPVSFAELFCADGYFAIAAAHFGATECIGIDDNRDGYSDLMPKIADALGLPNVKLQKMAVEKISV